MSRTYQFHTANGLTNPMDEAYAMDWLKDNCNKDILGMTLTETMTKDQANDYLAEFGLELK